MIFLAKTLQEHNFTISSNKKMETKKKLATDIAHQKRQDNIYLPFLQADHLFYVGTTEQWKGYTNE